MRILLIEPDRMLAETYSQALISQKHEVTPCASAQAAVLAADQEQPDCVILELQLIDHSGIEFLYEFRSYDEWKHIPVIVHTQVPAQEFAGSWNIMQKQLGINQYLYKPHTTLEQLIQAVGKYVPARV